MNDFEESRHMNAHLDRRGGGGSEMVTCEESKKKITNPFGKKREGGGWNEDAAPSIHEETQDHHEFERRDGVGVFAQ